VTNVPAQALALLNDAFVLQQADVWSQRLVARTDDSIRSRIDAMFHTALNRFPTTTNTKDSSGQHSNSQNFIRCRERRAGEPNVMARHCSRDLQSERIHLYSVAT